MDAHPAEFGTGIGRIIELEAAFLGLDQHRDQALEHEGAADAGARRIVRRHAMAELADRFRNVRAEKDQFVFVGMGQPELQIGLAEAADALTRLCDGVLDLADPLDQHREGLIAEGEHHLLLVLEVQVQRGG